MQILPVGNYSYVCNTTGNVNYSSASTSNNLTVSSCTDADGDGYCTPIDCNDANSAINPGASEVCDGVDNNCDGSTDEGCGGGGGGGQPPVVIPPVVPPPVLPPVVPPPIIEPSVIEKTPEGEEIGKLTPDQISEIKGATKIRYIGMNRTGGVGKTTNISFTFTNTGNITLKNLKFEVEKPEMAKAGILHPSKTWGWNWLNLIGWILRGTIGDLSLLEWKVSEPKKYDILRPGESIDLNLGVITPLTSLNLVDLKFRILSYGNVIYEETVPVAINATQFLVIADIHNETRTVDLYMVITNQADHANTYYVDLNINTEQDPEYKPDPSLKGFFNSMFKGPSTLVAEYYGPFRVEPKSTKLFAYSYEYAKEFTGDYYIKYTLYEGSKKIKTAKGPLNLISGNVNITG
jgi:hypothetical protein